MRGNCFPVVNDLERLINEVSSYHAEVRFRIMEGLLLPQKYGDLTTKRKVKVGKSQ